MRCAVIQQVVLEKNARIYFIIGKYSSVTLLVSVLLELLHERNIFVMVLG